FAGTMEQENNYIIRTIVPSVTGYFSIEVIEANLPRPDSPEFSDDTFVFLYSSFDPNAPLDGLMLANDDITADNLLSKIEAVTLTAGEMYYIVMTSFSFGITGPVTFQVKGPSTVIVSDIVNTSPTATHLDQSISFTEDDESVALDDIVVTDPDEGEAITATLTISSTAAGSLTTGTYGSATSFYNAGPGVWTVSGSVDEVNAALAAVAFIPAANWDQDFTITSHVEDAAETGPEDG